jgi:hypothetical protein
LLAICTSSFDDCLFNFAPFWLDDLIFCYF